jgi:hypothetical protein
VESTVEIVKEIPIIQEKVVELQTQRTRMHEVDRLVEKVVRVPQIVEVERTVPVILIQQ